MLGTTNVSAAVQLATTDLLLPRRPGTFQVVILVLASDATHYYENMEATRPFSIVFDVPAMVAGYDLLRALAAPDGVIVPGHDPMVFERHPPADPALSGIAVRLG